MENSVQTPVSVPVLPDHAPFTKDQIAWLNGYFAGLFSWRTQGQMPAVPALTQRSPAKVAVCVGFGSQGGTAEGLAKKIGKQLGAAGHEVTVLDMSRMDEGALKKNSHLLLVTSTYGNGEPPDNIKGFHQWISQASPLGLSNLKFGVLGLGDTQYAKFNQCAKDLDAQLERHGASRLLDRVDCDVDFEESFKTWAAAVKPLLVGPAEGVSLAPSSAAPAVEVDEEEKGPTRSKPRQSRVLQSVRLSGADSAKEIRQIVFDTGSGEVPYEAGDALGVYPENDPQLVEAILEAGSYSGETAVAVGAGATMPLREALVKKLEISRLPKTFGDLFGKPAGLAPAAFEDGLDLLDGLTRLGKKVPAAADLVLSMRPLAPRLYSISSSPLAHPGEVHLTVGAVRYEKEGRKRSGVASVFLAERVLAGKSSVAIYPHVNRAFRLPADGNTPVIMIGPGTGIAPFRAFLEERQVTGAKGPNWLFFGDQHASCDYIYRDEIEGFRKDGLLTRLDLAFSRDQKEKIYVQNRMLEHAGELMAWLEEGACLYVCGDGARMAKDVEEALTQVLMTCGEKNREGAEAVIRDLQAKKRYLRDVY